MEKNKGGRQRGSVNEVRTDSIPITELLESLGFNRMVSIAKTFSNVRFTPEELDALEKEERKRIPRDKDGFQLIGSFAKNFGDK